MTYTTTRPTLLTQNARISTEQKSHHRARLTTITFSAVTIVAIAILAYLIATTSEPIPRFCFSNGDQAPIACNAN